MGKRFDACTPRAKRDGGSWWHRVGSAFENDKGLITVYLDSYPVPDADGRVAIMLFEPKDDNQPRQRRDNVSRPDFGSRPLSEDLDDEIPF